MDGRPDMGNSVDLVVLGAGPAGLAAAWRAARRGLSVLVLERAETVGGMAASFEIAGMRVDLGSHRLNPDMPSYIMADLKSVLGTDLQMRYRNGRMLIGGRWVTYPFKPRELARALPTVPMARAAFDALATSWRRSRTPATEADSYADLMRAGFGPTLYKMVYEPYSRKLWGIDASLIDGDQARRKAGSPTAFSALVRSVRRSLSNESLAYLYPRQGFGQLCEALADAAVREGAQVRLGSAVENIDVSDRDVTLHLARSEFHGSASSRGGWSGSQHWAEDGGWLHARHVFSTIPLPLLARMTRPGAPYEAVEASGALHYRAILLVYAVHAGGRWTSHDVHYVPDGDTPITRISEPLNHRISLEDPEDRSVVCFEIPCEVGDPLWNAGEDELTAVLQDALHRTGLPALNLEWLQVKRLRQVYPVYRQGYRKHVMALDSWVDALPNLTTFGRLGLFTPDNTHHALMMGYEAADALGTGSFDENLWRAARDRFQRHTVET
jgi:protoporphyrinogen oxidase